MSHMQIYHGSSVIIETLVFGLGKAYNDYGRGFYCTENIELAGKEWLNTACLILTRRCIWGGLVNRLY